MAKFLTCISHILGCAGNTAADPESASESIEEKQRKISEKGMAEQKRIRDERNAEIKEAADRALKEEEEEAARRRAGLPTIDRPDEEKVAPFNRRPLVKRKAEPKLAIAPVQATADNEL